MNPLIPKNTIAATTNTRTKAILWSLVLSALGITHRVEKDADLWQIRVNPDDQLRAQHEIAAYEEENHNWPPPRPSQPPPLSVGRHPPTVLVMGIMAILYSITGPWNAHSPWFAQGAVMADKILDHGEWWRLVTALTLHADTAHLFSNLIIGAIPVHFLCRTLGAGLGWSLILASGVGGNYLNIVLRNSDHVSVGFSTAVFGALGILVGYQALSKKGQAMSAVLAPLAAGIALLGLMGSGGERTDLGAHLLGFAAGTVIGVLSWLAPRDIIDNSRAQRILLALCFTAVFLSWRMARS